MTTPANPVDDPGDAATLAACAAELVEAVDATVARWAERSIVGRWTQWQGRTAPVEVTSLAEAVGAQVRGEVVPVLRELLAADVDAQRGNPLAVLRGAVPHLTAALRTLGVPAVERDAQAVQMFPEDAYDLTPAAFADIDESVHEPGLVWGAAKAHVVIRRRKG